MAALMSSMLGSYYNQAGPTPAELREAFLSQRSDHVLRQIVDDIFIPLVTTRQPAADRDSGTGLVQPAQARKACRKARASGESSRITSDVAMVIRGAAIRRKATPRGAVRASIRALAG